MVTTITMVKEKYALEILSEIGGSARRSYDDKIDVQFMDLKEISIELTSRYLILRRDLSVVKIPSKSYHGINMIQELPKNFMNIPE